MVERLPLSAHTSYAELTERLRLARIGEFPAGATFTSKTVKERLYWYVQLPAGGATGRRQLYVGADSEALRARIAAHAEIKADAADRRRLVAAIIASGAHRPDRLTGDIIQALADAGAFRLRAVLVGTVAFQTYAAHLGVRLPASGVGTQDLDVAQDYGISISMDDCLPTSLFDVLKTVDPGFTPVSYAFDPARVTSYALGERCRVDILTTNRGPPRDKPSTLPALKADAVPLQYMDFLLRDPIDAAMLHGSGILVNVPAPARFAVHKLLISRARTVNREKARKDLVQAAHLIEALSAEDPFALRDAYAEARERGPTWRELLDEALAILPAAAAQALA